MVRGIAQWGAFLACAFMLAAVPAAASSTPDPSLRKAANIITIALPVTAIGVSLLHHEDWKGIEEFAVSAGLTVGTAYLLRQSIRDRRPDHSDYHGLTPPDLALADASSDYLWSRYGWRYGVPAWIASGVVSYALTDGRKNHWYDTLGTGVIAFGFNYALVDRYHPGRFHVSADPVPGGGGMVHVSMNF
ncbi:MAG TPA: hypothetical protein VHZ78_11915 [Rhizomicrobium sp.]|jgi:hypothetical protein|nr:hypothetical protein [Rhizomicrobium sp.]